MVVIIDFDNVYDHTLGADLGWFRHELNSITQLALDLDRAATAVAIRFYGGWRSKGALTPLASELITAMAGAPFFPMPHPVTGGILRGEISLAASLLQVGDVEWPDTRNIKQGLPTIRLSKQELPQNCAKPEGCPVRTLQRFTKHRRKTCPLTGCAVTNQEAFVTVEQKMVDTLMACDVIAAGQDSTVNGIMVVTDDCDLLPAVVMAARTSPAKQVHLLRTDRARRDYDALLAPTGVQIRDYRRE